MSHAAVIHPRWRETYSQVTIKMIPKVKNLRSSPACQSEKVKQVSLQREKKDDDRLQRAATCKDRIRFQTEVKSNIHLFVDLSFIQTFYPLPPQVSVAIQESERPLRSEVKHKKTQ